MLDLEPSERRRLLLLKAPGKTSFKPQTETYIIFIQVPLLSSLPWDRTYFLVCLAVVYAHQKKGDFWFTWGSGSLGFLFILFVQYLYINTFLVILYEGKCLCWHLQLNVSVLAREFYSHADHFGHTWSSCVSVLLNRGIVFVRLSQLLYKIKCNQSIYGHRIFKKKQIWADQSLICLNLC